LGPIKLWAKVASGKKHALGGEDDAILTARLVKRLAINFAIGWTAAVDRAVYLPSSPKTCTAMRPRNALIARRPEGIDTGKFAIN
jgi:hypothetical protein